MLRRRIKRHADSRDCEKSTVERKKRTVSDVDENEVEETLEKLVFQFEGVRDLVNEFEVMERPESRMEETDVEVRCLHFKVT